MNNQLVKANSNLGVALTVIDRKAMENLLPAEKKLIQAALQPKVRELEPFDVVKEFISIITTTYTRAGQNADQATLALYADEFYSSLNEKYPDVTIEEVREALKAGVYGEAGEYFGLNPKSFMQFVKHYLFADQRKEARTQFESKRLSISLKREQLTLEEKVQDDKDYTNYLYSHYLKGKLIVDFIPTFVYDFLEAQGLINLSLEEKLQINERAVSYLNRLKASDKYKGNTRSLGDTLTAYIRSRDEKITISVFAKQLAVSDYFEIKKNAGVADLFDPEALVSFCHLCNDISGPGLYHGCERDNEENCVWYVNGKQIEAPKISD